LFLVRDSIICDQISKLLKLEAVLGVEVILTTKLEVKALK
jgi:hypothetical protein